MNAACNTGVVLSCTYRKHGKIIQEGRASKDSHITTSHQHSVLQNINLLATGQGLGASTPCAVVQPKMHSELYTCQNTILLLQ